MNYTNDIGKENDTGSARKRQISDSLPYSGIVCLSPPPKPITRTRQISEAVRVRNKDDQENGENSSLDCASIPSSDSNKSTVSRNDCEITLSNYPSSTITPKLQTRPRIPSVSSALLNETPQSISSSNSNSNSNSKKLLKSPSDTLILKFDFPVKGIQSSIALRVSRKSTVGDAVKLAINEFKLSTSKKEIVSKFSLFLFNDDEMMLENNTLVEKCGFSSMEKVFIRPRTKEEEEEMGSLLTSNLSTSTDSLTVHHLFTKAGYLLKKKTSTFSRQVKRWVVLKDNVLYYFSSPRDTVSIGSINLDSTTVTFHLNNPKLCHTFNVYLFGKTSYQFSCENREEAELWERAIFGKVVDESAPQRRGQATLLSSTVNVRGARRFLYLSKEKRISVLVSPADPKESFGMDLLSSKVLFNSPLRKISFASNSSHLKVTFLEERDFCDWVKQIRACLGDNAEEKSAMFANVDINEGVIKNGWLEKKKTDKTFSSKKKRFMVLKGFKWYYFDSIQNLPLGVFDLLHTNINLNTNDSLWKIDVVTNSSSYSFFALDPTTNNQIIKEWYTVLCAQSIGSPFNVVHRAHVGADLAWTGGEPHTHFALQCEVGRGGYATVYKAVHRETGFVLAVKIMSTQHRKNTMLKTLQSEIDALKQCRSTTIVSYYGSFITEQELWILMDYCACGSVKDVLQGLLARGEKFTESQIAYICCETVKGLIYLHSIKIVHHDIKAGNILATENGVIKLADFGVARSLSENDRESLQVKDEEWKNEKGDDEANENAEENAAERPIPTDYIGSPHYMSPEILSKQSFSAKTDIWSLGITTIELVEGFPPNHDAKTFEELKKRLAPKIAPKLKEPHQWSTELNEFIALCLIFDPTQRPCAVDLVASPFLCTLPTKECLLPVLSQHMSNIDSNGNLTDMIPARATSVLGTPHNPTLPTLPEEASETRVQVKHTRTHRKTYSMYEINRNGKKLTAPVDELPQELPKIALPQRIRTPKKR